MTSLDPPSWVCFRKGDPPQTPCKRENRPVYRPQNRPGCCRGKPAKPAQNAPDQEAQLRAKPHWLGLGCHRRRYHRRRWRPAGETHFPRAGLPGLGHGIGGHHGDLGTAGPLAAGLGTLGAKVFQLVLSLKSSWIVTWPDLLGRLKYASHLKSAKRSCHALHMHLLSLSRPLSLQIRFSLRFSTLSALLCNSTQSSAELVLLALLSASSAPHTVLQALKAPTRAHCSAA